MNQSKMTKKFIAICSILLLVLNFLPSFRANIVKFDDDGIAYDEFNDADGISSIQNCTLENGSIKLTYGPATIHYDYDLTPNKIEGWKYRETLVNPGEAGIVGALSKFTSPDNIPLSEDFETSDYTKIKSIDSSYVETESLYGYYLNHTYYPMNRYRFELNQSKDFIQNFDAYWKAGEFDGGADEANIKDISMYIWSYGDPIPRWEYIDHTNLSGGDISAPNQSTVFISSKGVMDILIVGTPLVDGPTSILYSDYVNVTIKTITGYLPQGYVISKNIEPAAGTFNGWESVIWDGSRPAAVRYLKLQVLREDNTLIETLDGNTNGFTSSPIDLSSLGTSYSKIRLKATLYSDDLESTPYLYSWGVLWQTTGGFHDSFNFDFRVDKTYGIEIGSGEVKISKYYGDWPIFGKDPTNTRAYIGPEAGVGSNKTYWFTERGKDIGGWFRSPIMNNGRIYIGSNDNKIYAFNLTTISPGDQQNPVDVSDANYKIETAVAANNNLVIVATSKLDSKSNKIYALNSTDLSDVKWTYPTSDFDNTICFSASPTIANGKVFVTSWYGGFWNKPSLSYLYSRLNSILGYKLGLNNKLFALDLNSGNPIWDPIVLPAGSFSTPAVADGLIFVGCENYQGPSLFAYDENTGEQVWNASVGAIGRSSPVVVKSDIGKVVIVLSRVQSLLSYTGVDKVVAVNAETGKELWNKTIGNESSILRTTILKILDFEHTMAISPPAATPTAFGDTVFAMFPDGKVYALNVNTGDEQWIFDINKEVGSIYSYYTASPVAVDNIVYLTSPEGYIFLVDTSTGELIRDIYPFEYSDYKYPPPTYPYASPIVTNGLILLSVIESNPVTSATIGRLFCVGEYSNNSFGKIYSIPIHVQKGKWWSTFNAHYENTTENTVKFSILDEQGNILMSGLNGTNNDISNPEVLRSGAIQLCAELTIGNESQAPPVLKDWEILWTAETTAPVFDGSSFKPDPNRWIRNNTPVCSIKVYDAWPGLDVSSARYRITNTSNVKSDWYVADCTGINGTKNSETITADISKLNLDPNASDLKTIEISIKDLSGNEATFNLGGNFRIDRLKPTSWINTTFSDYYNEPFNIKVDGSDPGDPNINMSGINTITLYNRSTGEEEWHQYGSPQSPSIDFVFEQSVSGNYEVCTVATDNAGNVQEFPNESQASFTFDMNKPDKPEFKELYEFNTIPEFTVNFTDDYMLKTVEYKLNLNGTWIEIGDDINSTTYEGKWSLTNQDWQQMEDEQTYYIYFRVTDTCGNQYITPITPSNEEALAFKIDTIPPGSNVSLDLSDLQGGGWKDTFTITADVPYDQSIAGVTLEYSYSSDNSEWSEWKQYEDKLTEGPYTWEFKADDGSGYYRFKSKIWDAAGNSKESPVQEVNLTKFPAALVTLMIILFVILIVITILFVRKMKKKK